MPQQELQTTLQELRLELDKLHFDHEAGRDSVNKSVAVLEEKLREESFMSGDEFLVHELSDALTHFEESHPQITDLLGRVSDLLSKMGI
ncbi:MAG: DUF4404 family protein [Gammaproteobacteria bacterium]|jgi:hypothetical protein|nr:DUF4404 family protein [Gammaproteobacteria bacterium]MBT4492838.1 DUF4404 family protein [Gammaproteobacteria bacterium]MBT7369883.1 DUF4404 family protein [Gammaproteobacteria bacterium]